MTKEEILAMEAGEELDRLVATEVMGEPIPEFTPEDALGLQLAGSPVKSPQGNWLCLCKYEEGDIPVWRPLAYSTGILAAWQVWLTVTKGDPYRWAIYPNPIVLGEVIVEHYPYYCAQERDEGDISITGEFPEAVCKAALLAKLETG